MREALRKEERTLKKREIVEILRRGKKVKSENLSIFTFANKKGLRRIVINVSSKVGKAVVRNRIKRIYREIFRKNKEIFPESYDIIISSLRDVSSFPKEVLIEELLSNFSKLKNKGNC